MRNIILLAALIFGASNAFAIPQYVYLQGNVLIISGDVGEYMVGDPVEYYFLIDRDLPAITTYADGRVVERPESIGATDIYFADLLMGDMLAVPDFVLEPYEIVEYNWGSENLTNGRIGYRFGTGQYQLDMGFYPTGGYDGGGYWAIIHSLLTSKAGTDGMQVYVDGDSMQVSDTPFHSVSEPPTLMLMSIALLYWLVLCRRGRIITSR